MDTEIWYVIEVSTAGTDDWYVHDARNYDSVDSAADAIIRFIERAQGRAADHEYRVVRKTLTSEVAGTVKPKEGK